MKKTLKWTRRTVDKSMNDHGHCQVILCNVCITYIQSNPYFGCVLSLLFLYFLSVGFVSVHLCSLCVQFVLYDTVIPVGIECS